MPKCGICVAYDLVCPVCENYISAMDHAQETSRLQAEIDRLRAENEKLKAALDQANRNVDIFREGKESRIKEILRLEESNADWIKRMAEAKAENVTLLEMLEAMVDDETCAFDHHGNCQTHYVTNPCVVEAVREKLRKAGRIS